MVPPTPVPLPHYCTGTAERGKPRWHPNEADLEREGFGALGG